MVRSPRSNPISDSITMADAIAHPSLVFIESMHHVFNRDLKVMMMKKESFRASEYQVSKMVVLVGLLALPFIRVVAQIRIEKWRVFETTIQGSDKGNPFAEIRIGAVFANGTLRKTVQGFYDGNGLYKIRFMPNELGVWSYETFSNSPSLRITEGSFTCIEPTGNNHGPVGVKDTFYFAYADGKPHYSFGTTCYAWVHQGDTLAQQTLRTLANGYFNKIRMCIFPKDYHWNKNEPALYPFEGKPLTKWDYARLNPAYFQNIERRIAQLDSLGIEADLIVFHPYDRWGFSTMDRKTDDLYINYVIARFAAFKNVWWSMANEYDFMDGKKLDDWDHYIKLFAENDPYNHLRSIHNGAVWYDHTNPLLTHASIQNEETYKAKEIRMKYKKPVVFDECRYEGNIPLSWGNLTGEEMVNKFWRGVTNGGFVGHGDTYVTENPAKWPQESNDVLWWSKGGVVRGKSPERIKFLRNIVESSPGFLQPVTISEWWMPFSSVSYKDEYYLVYYNMDQPRSVIINLPEKSKYRIEIIDAWNMTFSSIDGEFSGTSLVQLPQKPFIGLRILKK